MGAESIESDGNVLNIIQSIVDPNLFIFQGLGGTSWITSNCAESTAVIHHGATLIKFQFHPTQRTWILALSKFKCNKTIAKVKKGKDKEVNNTVKAVKDNCKERTELMVT